MNYDITKHNRGLDGNTPKVIGGVTLTEPSVLYWVTGKPESKTRSNYANYTHQYVYEYPTGMSHSDYTVSDRPADYESFQRLVADAADMTGRFGVVVDMTLRDEPNVLTIKSVEQVGDRDYILTFNANKYAASTSTRHDVRYALNDCNHFAHAVNRFKKRVRAICTTLGVTVDFVQHVNYTETDNRPQPVTAPEPVEYVIYARWGDKVLGERIGASTDAFTAMRQAQGYYHSLTHVFTNVKVWVDDPVHEGQTGGSFNISSRGITVN